MSSTMRVPLLFGFVLVMHHYMASSLLAQAKPSDEISFNVSSGSKQTVYMHKICVNSTLDNAAVLTTVRESTVQFNMMQRSDTAMDLRASMNQSIKRFIKTIIFFAVCTGMAN
jgi:hypothetical protein